MQAARRRRRRQSGRRMVEIWCQARRDWQLWGCPFVRLGAKSKGESLGQIQTRPVQQRQTFASLHRGVSIRPGSRRARQAWRPSMMGVAQQIVPQGILDATLDSWSPARPPHHNLVRHTASAATAPPQTESQTRRQPMGCDACFTARRGGPSRGQGVFCRTMRSHQKPTGDDVGRLSICCQPPFSS